MKVLNKILDFLALFASQRIKARKVLDKTIYTPPRINLVTTWNTRCGVATYSAFLANELKRNLKVRIVQMPEISKLNMIYIFLLGIKAGTECDVVHVQFQYGIFGASALPFYLGLLLSKVRIVTTLHEVMREIKPGIVGKYHTLLNKAICGVSDLIIVHTLASKELLLKIYRAYGPKVKVVPHGSYENPLFLDKNACKAKLNLSEKKVVTILGFVRRSKGHDLAIELVPLLDKEVHLLVAGGPRVKQHEAYYKELKRKAKQLGCIDRITFYGYVLDKRIPVIMNATDTAILPNLYGVTQSGILHMLIAYRVPTITSDLDAYKETKNMYGCIELFKTGDRRDLFLKVLSLLYDEEKQRLLKVRCEKMRNDTKWSVIAEKHIELYLEAVAGHSDAIYNVKRQRERIDWLKENVSGRALEIGCATGFVTSYVGADVGLDTNAYRIRLAKRKHPQKDFIICDATRLPFTQNAFGTVLIPDILEHVPLEQAKNILAECRPIGKKFLITLPNADKANYDKSLVENPEHKWRPTRNMVSQLIDTCTIQYTSKGDFILVSHVSKP